MKGQETGEDHLEWLVKSRYETQSTSVKLHRLLHKQADKIKKNKIRMLVSQDLTGASFSLWRAVFLSDKDVGYKSTFQHGLDFLEKVILDNAIGYNQDRNSRNWTFNYYVNNARSRLEHVAERWPHILASSNVSYSERMPKLHWEYYQRAFATAVLNFENLVNTD